jgi:hypothetical protein
MSEAAVELVKFQHRRLKSGWEKNDALAFLRQRHFLNPEVRSL